MSTIEHVPFISSVERVALHTEYVLTWARIRRVESKKRIAETFTRERAAQHEAGHALAMRLTSQDVKRCEIWEHLPGIWVGVTIGGADRYSGSPEATTIMYARRTAGGIAAEQACTGDARLSSPDERILTRHLLRDVCDWRTQSYGWLSLMLTVYAAEHDRLWRALADKLCVEHEEIERHLL